MYTAPRAEPAHADPMLPQVASVSARSDEVADVVTLQFDAPGWQGCAPGQFTMLGLPGLGEIPVSVSGGIRPGETLEQTIRAVGPVSRALFDLPVGAQLTMRGPYGQGWPVPERSETPCLIVAGGLGLAPLRPLIRHRFRSRGTTGPTRVVIGAREPGSLLFTNRYDHWRSEGLEVSVTVDHAPPGWPGRVGVVTTLLDTVADGGMAYVCGPEIMMRLTAQALEGFGMPAGAIHVSLERNMQCGIGLCGHCQLGAVLLCRDGPVLPWAEAQRLLRVREL